MWADLAPHRHIWGRFRRDEPAWGRGHSARRAPRVERSDRAVQPADNGPRRIALLTALLGTWASLIAACEGDSVAANAEISVNPARIDFGEVKTGEARAVVLMVQNRSPTGTLRFATADILEGSSAAFSLGPTPTELLPLASAEVEVRYTADDGEADAGQVRFDTNAVNSPRLLVPLSSARTFPGLRVDPARIDFGNLASGDTREQELTIENQGLARLSVEKWSLRTAGFSGEACSGDNDCREGRCASTGTVSVCASACGAAGACPGGTACQADHPLGPLCLPSGAPPRAARGFTVSGPERLELAPGAQQRLLVRYAPGVDDRGSAALVLETTDPMARFFPVPLIGRPDDLPPVASAIMAPPIATSVGPGTQIALDGRASHDPEGGPLGYRWTFGRRPEGSRAELVSPRSSTTSFTVDLPGSYSVLLEVRDSSGQTSTNRAEVMVEAGPGARVSVRLSWDRADADLDLHVVAPGAAVGSLLDCSFDNPRPDWGPPGQSGDPQFMSSAAGEQIDAAALADGVYTIAVLVAAPSLAGPMAATVEVYFEDVRVAHEEVTLQMSDREWDVATLTRPSGRLLILGSIR